MRSLTLIPAITLLTHLYVIFNGYLCFVKYFMLHLKLFFFKVIFSKLLLIVLQTTSILLKVFFYQNKITAGL